MYFVTKVWETAATAPNGLQTILAPFLEFTFKMTFTLYVHVTTAAVAKWLSQLDTKYLATLVVNNLSASKRDMDQIALLVCSISSGQRVGLIRKWATYSCSTLRFYASHQECRLLKPYNSWPHIFLHNTDNKRINFTLDLRWGWRESSC